MNITFLGLHKTGKTTYAVGLFAGMTNQAFSSLELVKVTESVATLNAGLLRLSRRLAVSRTDTEHTETIGMQVRVDGDLHDLRVPDRSGEALRGTRNSRNWDAELLEELSEAEAIVLFLRPGSVKPGEPISELAAIIPAASSSTAQEEEAERPWSPAMMPTDVSMVDALQELSQASGRDSFPVVVVISAWDEVENLTPSEWMESRVPLLEQYLRSNANRFPSAVFGVSVQGSEFREPKDDEEAEAIEVEVASDEPDPWDRAICVDAEGQAVELAAPLVWAIRSGG